MGIVISDNFVVQRGRNFAVRVDRMSVVSGKVLGVIGPNGSGKTTFVEALAGLIEPHNGGVRVNDNPPEQSLRATKAIFGFIPDDAGWTARNFNARKYFALLRKLYGAAGVTNDMERRVVELAAALRFTQSATPLARLSRGNQKKVQIIAGLMHQPSVIIADELLGGLDPLAAAAAERLILEEAKRGAAVVAATNDLAWAERAADTILLLISGNAVLSQPTLALVKKYGSLQVMMAAIVGNPPT